MQTLFTFLSTSRLFRWTPVLFVFLKQRVVEIFYVLWENVFYFKLFQN